MPNGKKDDSFFEQLFSGLLEKKGTTRPEVGSIPVKPRPQVLGASPQTFPMPRMRIRFKGVFDFKGLYKEMVLWLKRRKFEFQERLYKDKPPELEILWRAQRRKSGYIMDVIEVHMHIFDIEPVEVIERGVKKELTNARMTITLWPTVETGYVDIFGQRKWDSEFHRRLMDFYNKYVIKKDLDLAHTDALYYELYYLHAMIKDHLKMEAKGNLY